MKRGIKTLIGKVRVVGCVSLAAVMMLTLIACGAEKEATPAGTDSEQQEETVTEDMTQVSSSETDEGSGTDVTGVDKNEASKEDKDDKEDVTADKSEAIDGNAAGDDKKDTSAATTPAVTDEKKELAYNESDIKAFDVTKTMYATKKINIRKGPSTDFESVGMLKEGEAIEAIGQDKDGWYEVKYKDQVVFASNLYLTDTEPVAAVPDAAAAAAVPAADTNAATQQTAAPAAAPKTVAAPAGVLIIGDSRCVMMRDAVGGGGVSWICQEAMGYNWLVNTAIPRADEIVGKGTKVVIALGVNDTGNVNNYAALIDAKAAEWAARGAKTYYVSVNPVWENPYVTEEQVEVFNNSIVGQLVGVKWIDTFSYLMGSSYRLVDGLHYDDETSARIFQAIIASL